MDEKHIAANKAENPVSDKLESLGRSIETTRKNRINAANRLEGRERFIQAVNIYYSCVSACTAILALVIDGKKELGIASCILTVILAISIVYLNAQKFGARAQQLQANYIAMQQLGAEIQAEVLKGTADPEVITKYQEKYAALLRTSENHIPQDHRETMYLQDKLDKRANNQQGKIGAKRRLSGKEKMLYWSNVVGGYIIHSVIWLLPVAAAFAIISGWNL